MDTWLEEAPLLDGIEGEVPEEEVEKTVKAYWSSNGWNIDKLRAWLVPDQIQKLIGVYILPGAENPDRLCWKPGPKGVFTTRSAYELSWLEEELKEESASWEKIWKARGPGRWQFLLWLVRHGKLLTHEEKAKRKLSVNPYCPICETAVESTIHAVRDCGWIKSIWKQFVRQDRWEEFLNKPMQSWVDWNLKDGRIGGEGKEEWQLIFQQIMYFAWSARNSFCATGDERMLDIKKGEICLRIGQAKEALLRGEDLGRKEVKFVRWGRPLDGWCKMNVDGAVNRTSGRAGAGGIFRDSWGRWKTGFTMSLGLTDILTAELWAILQGLELAWNSGEKQVILETDSRAALDLIQGAGLESPLSNMILLIRSFTRRDWECRLQHVWREGNRCADWLAKRSVNGEQGIQILTELQQELRELIGADILGAAIPRSIPA